MAPKEHANLLGIFAYIMAGWQILFSLLVGLYVLLVGGLAIGMALDPSVKDPGGPIFMGVVAAICCVYLVIGLAGGVTNILLGKRLRGNSAPTKKFVITASVINFINVFTGGIFAAGLGGYSIWFATSDVGNAFFAGEGRPYTPGFLPQEQYRAYDSTNDPNYARDPNRINWR